MIFHKKNNSETRILVIDDEEQILNYVKYALEKEGYVVTVAQNGNEAMQIFSTAEFDVVITDIAMPGKDGIDTIIEIRQINPPVAIVAMSGVASSDKLLRLATTFDADVTLKKPFTTEELIEAVNQARRKKFRFD